MGSPDILKLVRFSKRERSYSTNSLVSLGGYAITSVLTLGFGIIAARALGPDGNGKLSLLLVIMSTVPVLINGGLGQAAVYAINRQKASVEAVANELWTTAWIWGGISAVGVLIGCAIWNLKSPGLFSVLVICVAVLLTPPLLARNYAEYLYTAMHRFGWQAVVLMVDLVLRLVLFTALIHWRGGVDGAVLAVTVAALVSTSLGWANLMANLGRPRMAPLLPTLRPLLSYGWINHLSVLAGHLNLRVDQFLIAAALPVRELGVYVTAVTLAELPLKIATAVSKVLFAKVASSNANEATQLTSATLRIVMTLAWMIAALVWLLRDPLVVAVYGTGYADAGLALAWLLPGAVLFNYVQILNSDLAGRGYPMASAVAGAAGLVTGVVANLTLTSRIGIAGAAISTSMGYAVNSGVVIYRYCQLTGEPPTRLLWVTWSDVQKIVVLLQTYARKLL
ncbi:MAG: lipopolysaccharide biosynthesis protein [Verrucomicrobiota bacterium]